MNWFLKMKVISPRFLILQERRKNIFMFYMPSNLKSIFSAMELYIYFGTWYFYCGWVGLNV